MEKIICHHVTQAKIAEVIHLETLENLWLTKIQPYPQQNQTEAQQRGQESEVAQVERLSEGNIHDLKLKQQNLETSESKQGQHRTSLNPNILDQTLQYLEVLAPHYPLQTLIQYTRITSNQPSFQKVVVAHNSLVRKANIFVFEELKLREEISKSQVPIHTEHEKVKSSRYLKTRYYESNMLMNQNHSASNAKKGMIEIDTSPYQEEQEGEDIRQPMCMNCLSEDHSTVMCKFQVALTQSRNTSLMSWVSLKEKHEIRLVRCMFCSQIGHNNCKFEDVSMDDNLYNKAQIKPQLQPSKQPTISPQSKVVECN
jgi:hypothetical protein